MEKPLEVMMPSRLKGDWNRIRICKNGKIKCDCVAHKYIKDKPCHNIKDLKEICRRICKKI